MVHGQMRLVLRHLRRLVRGPEDGASDGALLERFAVRQDESAFEELLRRHAGLVLGVCRRVLSEPQDVEDAFQATFLVLVRKAGSLNREGSLGPWLYTVAYHTALRARAATARRRREERRVPRLAVVPPDDELIWRDLRPVLDEELARLGEKYRAPVVLCYLEGKTHEEAARELGWPRGTVAGRLDRAKKLLRQRLARRGIELAPVASLPNVALSVGAPALLLASTLTASALQASGQMAFSAQVVALGEAVLPALSAGRIKALLVGVLALTLASGGGLVSGLALRDGPAPVVRLEKVPADRVVGRERPRPQPVDGHLGASNGPLAPPVCGHGKEAQGEKHMAKPLVSDELWERIQPLLPAPKPRRARHPGRKPLEPRKVLTGILFVLKTGIPWEELPVEMGCGCGMTCLNYLKSWHQAGIWPKLQEVLLASFTGAERIDWSRAAVDAPPPVGGPVVCGPTAPSAENGGGPCPTMPAEEHWLPPGAIAPMM